MSFKMGIYFFLSLMYRQNTMFSRSEPLLGKAFYKILENKTVCLFGLGGVGGYVAEILVRSGIKHLILIDGDTVEISNLNRQIIATHSNVGRLKTECMRERLLDIAPDIHVSLISAFVLPESKELSDIFSLHIDYVIDAIDTITVKVEIAKQCEKNNIPIICATGCGNRLTAEYRFEDIYKTNYCPVCRILRKLLKEANVSSLKVLYSPTKTYSGKTVASVPWTPAIAGIMIGSQVIQDLLKKEKKA